MLQIIHQLQVAFTGSTETGQIIQKAAGIFVRFGIFGRCGGLVDFGIPRLIPCPSGEAPGRGEKINIRKEMPVTVMVYMTIFYDQNN